MFEFFLRVLQIAIGSALGFLMGIWAFHYQQEQLQKRKLADRRNDELDALSRLAMAAGANLESLAIFKNQFLNELRPEVSTMKQHVNSVYSAKDENRDKSVSSLLLASKSMVHFYRAFAKPSHMPVPNHTEYSSLRREMPALSMFVHRAACFTEELNDCLTERNNRISLHASEGTLDVPMTPQRSIYFASMLSDEGIAMCNLTDYALHCWKITLDQINEYVDNRVEGGSFVRPKLTKKALDELPDENTLPGLRSQIRYFD
ncbi:hypothetical protein K1718_13410 [Roseibium porphyridii]|uniref:Uncharacterized protein n=1 Tax=Roseibium porphyridii TaxID=2866279 RepID=A0ABY8FA30_9HYPH|nr:hypothetical protein [Roseibium sp. KMA01]WFE92317.1 hypothetical protein K1718_13410 [Roseibium sp. KMA01]